MNRSARLPTPAAGSSPGRPVLGRCRRPPNAPHVVMAEKRNIFDLRHFRSFHMKLSEGFPIGGGASRKKQRSLDDSYYRAWHR